MNLHCHVHYVRRGTHKGHAEWTITDTTRGSYCFPDDDDDDDGDEDDERLTPLRI